MYPVLTVTPLMNPTRKNHNCREVASIGGSDVVKSTSGLLIIILSEAGHRAHVVVILAFCALLLGCVLAGVPLNVL